MSSHWDVEYSSIEFFKKTLLTHTRVSDFKQIENTYFYVSRVDNLPDLHVLLVDIYTISQADVIRAKKEYPNMDCFVTGSKWNSYTTQAKNYGKRNHIGVFNISEFLGALWKRKPFKYVKKD